MIVWLYVWRCFEACFVPKMSSSTILLKRFVKSFALSFHDKLHSWWIANDIVFSSSTKKFESGVKGGYKRFAGRYRFDCIINSTQPGIYLKKPEFKKQQKNSQKALVKFRFSVPGQMYQM